MGNSYINVIKNLEEWGILHRSKSYVKGDSNNAGQCKAFWLDMPYMLWLKEYYYSREVNYVDKNGKVKHYGRFVKAKIYGTCLSKRIKMAAKEVKVKQLENPVVFKCHENLKHFQMDTKQAYQVIENLQKSGEINEKQAYREVQKVERFNGIYKSDTALYVKQDTYGRIHTNITQMKKEIRNSCLYCDGKETIGVDMKSSQAAILTHILGFFVYGKSNEELGEKTPFVDINSSILNVFDRNIVETEYQSLVKILQERRLYEFFANEMANDKQVNRCITRDEAKKAFLAMLFSKVFIDESKTPLWGAVRRVWRSHFPCMLKCIDYMKKTNYASLAYEMQRNESNFIYNVVIPRIESELGCYYCTVHDSIVVQREYGAAVQRIMDEELARVGIPTMTEQEYDIKYPSIHQKTLDYYVETEMEYVNSIL